VCRGACLDPLRGVPWSRFVHFGYASGEPRCPTNLKKLKIARRVLDGTLITVNDRENYESSLSGGVVGVAEVERMVEEGQSASSKWSSQGENMRRILGAAIVLLFAMDVGAQAGPAKIVPGAAGMAQKQRYDEVGRQRVACYAKYGITDVGAPSFGASFNALSAKDKKDVTKCVTDAEAGWRTGPPATQGPSTETREQCVNRVLKDNGDVAALRRCAGYS
jgi:hypothetical protein